MLPDPLPRNRRNTSCFQRFVALGDSLSFGTGDSVEGIHKIPWPDQVTDILQRGNPNLLYSNLAQPGLKTSEVKASQLSAALSLNPDLVSIQVGSNDVVERSWNPQNYYQELLSIAQPFREIQATVVMLTCHNSKGMPRKLGRLRLRFQEMVDVIQTVSHEQSAIFVDLSSSFAGSHISHWSSDRWHPNALGYQEATKSFLLSLEKTL